MNENYCIDCENMAETECAECFADICPDCNFQGLCANCFDSEYDYDAEE